MFHMFITLYFHGDGSQLLTFTATRQSTSLWKETIFPGWSSPVLCLLYFLKSRKLMCSMLLFHEGHQELLTPTTTQSRKGAFKTSLLKPSKAVMKTKTSYSQNHTLKIQVLHSKASVVHGVSSRSPSKASVFLCYFKFFFPRWSLPICMYITAKNWFCHRGKGKQGNQSVLSTLSGQCDGTYIRTCMPLRCCSSVLNFHEWNR